MKNEKKPETNSFLFKELEEDEEDKEKEGEYVPPQPPKDPRFQRPQNQPRETIQLPPRNRKSGWINKGSEKRTNQDEG